MGLLSHIPKDNFPVGPVLHKNFLTMETFQRVISGRQKIPVEGFLNFTPLSHNQQHYLTAVYAVLAASIVATGAGVAFSISFFSIPLFLAVICQFGCMMYIGATAAPAVNGTQGLKVVHYRLFYQYIPILNVLIQHSNLTNLNVLMILKSPI